LSTCKWIHELSVHNLHLHNFDWTLILHSIL
jgi:hypothetical protein